MEGFLIIGLGKKKVRTGIENDQGMDGSAYVSQGHAVNVAEAKVCLDDGSLAGSGPYGEISSGALGSHFEKGNAKSHFTGRTGGKERILCMGQLLRCHAAAVIPYEYPEPVCSGIYRYINGDEAGRGSYGIFCNIQNI